MRRLAGVSGDRPEQLEVARGYHGTEDLTDDAAASARAFAIVLTADQAFRQLLCILSRCAAAGAFWVADGYSLCEGLADNAATPTRALTVVLTAAKTLA